MSPVPVHLLVLFPVGIACAFKLAARVFWRTRLRWRHSFMFAVLMTGLIFLRVVGGRSDVELDCRYIGDALCIGAMAVLGFWCCKCRAQTAGAVALSFARAAALTALALPMALGSVVAITWADQIARARIAEAQRTDFALEVLDMSPKSGSTLMANEPITLIVKYAYRTPSESLALAVRVVDPNLDADYRRARAAIKPGHSVVTLSFSLKQPGKIRALNLLLDNAWSGTILEREIPVDYTVAAKPGH